MVRHSGFTIEDLCIAKYSGKMKPRVMFLNLHLRISSVFNKLSLKVVKSGGMAS